MTRAALLAIFLTCGCAPAGSGNWPLVAELHSEEAMQPTDRPNPSVVVATYNVAACRNPQGVRRDLVDLDADVLMLQELRLSPESNVRTLLPDGRWHLAVVPVNVLRAGSNNSEGQVIASRHPIKRVEVWPLSEKSRRRRCALAAWIDVAGREVLVVNTDHEPDPLGPATPTQDRHLKALIALLRQRDERSIVVGGDFNTCGNLWRMRSSASDAKHAKSALREINFQPGIASAYNSFDAWPLRACLDHLFIRGGEIAESGVMDSARGSDHRPVWCRVRFSDQP